MQTRLVVAAIDFGTTYSGYAYSLLDDFKKDPLKIYAPNTWSDGTGLITCKAPTVVLFNQDGEFDSFGYEAETKYYDLTASNEHSGWKFFRRFKMELYNSTKKIRKNTKIQDSQGQPMLALDVFSSTIRYLKDDLLTRLRLSNSNFRDTDINWVLTVPAIWDDAAKQFMILAAGKAGIPASQLVLAYEPEAAAIFCKEINTEISRQQNMEDELNPFDQGEKFMVIDLGGGTVDITAHEVLAEGKLKSLSAPSGGPWGGTVVDKNFHSLFENIFGAEIYKDFAEENAIDILDLDRMIELKKRSIKLEDKNIPIKIPSELCSYYKEKTKQRIEQSLSSGQYQGKVKRVRDRMNVESSIIFEMFSESKNEILQHVEMLLGRMELKDVKTLLLVGGFAESKVIDDAFRKKFSSGYRVMVPKDSGLAIVKGAVIYGHLPQSICSRRSKYAYGISTSVNFDPQVHSTKHKFIDKCEDIFNTFVKKGDDIVPGKLSRDQSFTAPNPGDRHVTVEIYKSDQDPPPMYVTECQKVGELVLELTNVDPNEKGLIVVQMSFGGTEILVEAKEGEGRDKRVSARFDWLK